MADQDSSGKKVAYDLRPSKQAERYIIVDVLRQLERLGLKISNYHYVGFGSFFFHDFRLFHHELNIGRMTSIEGDSSIISRCEFNKPYSAIDVYDGMSSAFLPSLERTKRYILWLLIMTSASTD
jgi:hypothetical protein